MDLSKYSSQSFNRGKPIWVEFLWRLISAFIFQTSWIPFYSVKRFFLRLFGARIGKGVIIKPRITITLPWKLEVGDYVWIGENAWLDSLDRISIGAHSCISQGAYLCTGNHDYKSPTFDLCTEEIQIGSGVWIAAKAIVGPGVTVKDGAVLCLGSIATSNLKANGVYQGNPAKIIGSRRVDPK